MLLRENRNRMEKVMDRETVIDHAIRSTNAGMGLIMLGKGLDGRTK